MTPEQIDNEIYNLAISNGFTDVSAKFVVAQARLESADKGKEYNSNNFKTNNNCFGMKFIGQPLATKGTLAPFSERDKKCRDTGVCSNRNFYAKFKTLLIAERTQ